MSRSPLAPRTDEVSACAKRRDKLKAWRAAGKAFPNAYVRVHLAGDLQERHEEIDRNTLDLNPVLVSVAGRIVGKRAMGKATFSTIQDMSGSIDLFLTDSYPGKEQHLAFQNYDVGDIIGADGVLFKTQSHELTIRVKQLYLLTKSLRSPPEPSKGSDNRTPTSAVRCALLSSSEEMRFRLVLRSRIVQAMRAYFQRMNYFEIETPMLKPMLEAAPANCFRTYHHALDLPLRLSSSQECCLDTLLAGGFQKVFEISRGFTNETMSDLSIPERTVLTFCMAFRNHYYFMRVIEKLIRDVALSTLGTTQVTFQGHDIDLGQPQTLSTMGSAITRFHPDMNDEALSSRTALTTKLTDCNITIDPEDSIGEMQFSLFTNTVISQLMEPTCVFHFPVEAVPFARRSDKEPGYTESFELYIGGMRVAHGFSGLNDPEDMTVRFEESKRRDENLDFGAGHGVKEHIRMLEHGVPPHASATMDMDRLVMILTDSPSIRDVIFFPPVAPG